MNTSVGIFLAILVAFCCMFMIAGILAMKDYLGDYLRKITGRELPPKSPLSITDFPKMIAAISRRRRLTDVLPSKILKELKVVGFSLDGTAFPTYAEAIDWLSTKQIYVSPYAVPSVDSLGRFYIEWDTTILDGSDEGLAYARGGYKTWHSAVDAGILFAVETLKEKK